VMRNKLVTGVFYARSLVDQFLKQFSPCVGRFSCMSDSVEERPRFDVARKPRVSAVYPVGRETIAGTGIKA